MPVLTGNPLGHRHALFFRLVRQHGAAHYVAHRPNAGHIGFAIGVHHDSAALVKRQAYCLRVQTGGIGHTADGHNQLVHVQRLRFAFGVGVSDGNAFFARLDLAHLDAQLDLQALLVKSFFRLFGDLLIHCAEECGQTFQNSHLRTQTAPDGTHLQTDHA